MSSQDISLRPEVILSENRASDAFRAAISQGQANVSARLVEVPVAPEDLAFRWKSGAATPADLVWSDEGDCLVGERFRRIMGPFTGWSSSPVILSGPSGNRIDGFHLLHVLGRSGTWMPTGTRRLPLDPEYFQDSQSDYRGLCFAAPPSGGTDFQLPAGSIQPILLSAAAASAMARLECDNFNLERCEDFNILDVIVEILRRDHAPRLASHNVYYVK